MKQADHQTRLLFLPDMFADYSAHEVRKRYKEHILDDIIPICEDSDIIGITLMTNYFAAAVEITQAIKRKMDIPVMWGGVHPTIRPEECLQYADMVCIGEGEESTLELLNRMQRKEPYWDTKGFWFKRDGTIIRNSLRPLTYDLDDYPIPDYSLNDHYFIFEDKITKMTPKLMRIWFETTTLTVAEDFGMAGYNVLGEHFGMVVYTTLTGRGCPHKCTYCSNNFYNNLYDEQGYYRWRSTKHVISELQWVKDNVPNVRAIVFSDDTFFTRSLDIIEEFARNYKEIISLPFFCLGSPLDITEEKLALLVDAGLIGIQMGVQTASIRLLEIFNRKMMSSDKTLKSMHTINKYKDRMKPPRYDFILDFPYETPQDKIETLKFISKIPKPFRLNLFSMVFYPATKLYEMAKKDGFIKDETEDIYDNSFDRPREGYLNLLFELAQTGRFPAWLLRIMLSESLVLVLNNKMMRPFFKYFKIILKGIYHGSKWLSKLGKTNNKVSRDIYRTL